MRKADPEQKTAKGPAPAATPGWKETAGQAADQSPLAVSLNQSPRVQAQLRMAEAVQGSARVRAQSGLATEINRAEAGKTEATTAQRVIAVKGGAAYTKKDDLPEAARENETLVGQATSGDRYLIASAADVVKRAQGQKPPMLTPHRHLIGESHNASRFEEALADWGWGADKMAEGFRTSALVKDKISDENRSIQSVGLVTNLYYQTKYLDNLHAAALHDLGMARYMLSSVKDIAKDLRLTANDVATGVEASTNKSKFSQDQKGFDKVAARFKAAWDVMNYLPSYKSACAARLKTVRGMGNAGPALLHDFAAYMQARWDKIDDNVKFLSGRPWGLFDSWKETATNLKTYVDNATDFIAFIDTFAGHLVALAQAEAATLPGDAEQNRNAVAQGWEKAKSGGVHEGGSEIREPFMADNINTKLNKPGIVQIGSEHVTNLAGKITDGKYHQSYDEFVEDTKK